MNRAGLLAVASAVVLAFAVPVAGAQQKASAPKDQQPALTALAAPRAAELGNAGVQKIVARTGKQRRDIQVLTTAGPIYFAWPKGVSPAPFELVVQKGGTVTVTAAGYSEAKSGLYGKAFDAVLPEAARRANEARAAAQRPKA